MNDNTKLFINTIDSLARCQGSYSRMSRDIHEEIKYNPEFIEQLNKNLPEFKDRMDVIMYIEG